MSKEAEQELRPSDKVFSVVLRWSEEDGCFIAEGSMFKYVSAHGNSPQDCLKEYCLALNGVLEVVEEDGEIIPDTAWNERKQDKRVAELLHEALRDLVGMAETYTSTSITRAVAKIKAALEEKP